MKKILLLTLLLCSSHLYAQNYYVCDTGDDNNAGTSIAAPLKTASRALGVFNSMNGGDSVLFCKGGKFPSPNRNTLFNPKCSANSVCTLGAYGQGNKPEIFSTGQTAALYFTDGGDPSPSKGYLIKELALVSDSTTLFGIQFFNDVDDVTIENVHIEGFGIGVYSAGANAVTSSTVNGTNDRLVLRDSTIINNYGQGWLGGGVGVLIENNIFENNGFEKAVFNHNIYLSGHENNPSSDIIVRGNTLYKSAFINGSCQGVSLVGHGLISNLLIEDNLIKEDEGTAGFGCWGIAIDPGYSMQEAFTGLTIRNNRVENVGGLAIGCASCVDVVVEGNTILDPSGSIRSGVAIPDRAEDSLLSDNVVIKNNTMLLGRVDATGVRASGANLFTVMGNSIDQVANSTEPCIDAWAGNANLDTSTNICTKNGVLPTPVDEPVDEPIDEPIDEPVGCADVSKQQLAGLLTQLTNLVNNAGNTVSAMRSVTDLYSKDQEVLNELAAFKMLLQGKKLCSEAN